jgi:thiol-disulfide isomerase/thioredoxin/YHS domain-containing protein
MRTTWFALSLCLPLAFANSARVALADPTATSVWKTDFAAAEAEAKAANRPLVVHFGAVWCGPCKKMEKEVLNFPQALQMLDAGFVAVKVDLDKNKTIGAKYGVQNMPTDLIISPEGKILVRSEGYEDIARVGDRDRKKYLANLSRINTQYAGAAKRQEQPKIADNRNGAEQRDPRNSARTAPLKTAPSNTDRALASAAPATKDKLVPPANKIDSPVGAQPVGALPGALASNDEPAVPDEINDVPVDIELEDVLVAMDGYCPVTLRTTRTWTTGDKSISLEHEGQIYYFVTADKRAQFKAHPARYAPRLLGCDPVTLADSDVAVRGSTQFGAFYDGALFLFENADSRAKFRKTPTRYSQLKHVLKPEDVKNVASNVDP